MLTLDNPGWRISIGLAKQAAVTAHLYEITKTKDLGEIATVEK